MNKCGDCKKETRGYGYEHNKDGRVYFCKECTQKRKKDSICNTWKYLEKYFAENRTTGATRNKEVVKAVSTIRSGWAGKTFVMISGRGRMVRYYYYDSEYLPDFAKHRR